MPRTEQCDVRWVDLRTAPPPQNGHLGELDEHERTTADAVRDPLARGRYVAAHLLTRRVLAAATGAAPGDLAFDRTCPRCGEPHGKPRLRGPRAVPFSVAHAADLVVVALLPGAPGDATVGVDIEPHPDPAPAHLLAVARTALAADERATYAALPVEDRPAALATWWARKEAVLKATGDGLVHGPAAVQVSPPFAAPEVTVWGGTDPPRTLLRDLRLAPGYAAAVAVLGVPDGGDLRLVVRRADDQVAGRAVT